MSIADRLTDAQFLASNDRHDGALLSVLVAVAATSRRRYPKDLVRHDRVAFPKFVADEMLVITSGGVANYNVRVPGSDPEQWPDGMMSLGECLYKFVRCSLAHEAILPDNVEFIDAEPGSMVIDIDDNRIQLSRSFVVGLSHAVMFAPENSDLFVEIARTPGDVIAWQLFDVRRENESTQEYMRNRQTRVQELADDKKSDLDL